MPLLLLLVMIGGLLIIPLGLPGLWVMLLALGVGFLTGYVGWPLLITLIALGLLAEFVEFIAVKRSSERYGGSRKAFWGALAGGLVGALIGLPVPVVGPLIAGVLGTFVGAAAVTVMEGREMRDSMRVGWGAAIGRGIAIAAKMAAAVVVLVSGGFALLF